MSGDRTEGPTPRRLRQARERGQVPRSRLFTGSLVLAGGSAGAALGLGEPDRALRGWTAALVARGCDVPAACHALSLLSPGLCSRRSGGRCSARWSPGSRLPGGPRRGPPSCRVGAPRSDRGAEAPLHLANGGRLAAARGGCARGGEPPPGLGLLPPRSGCPSSTRRASGHPPPSGGAPASGVGCCSSRRPSGSSTSPRAAASRRLLRMSRDEVRREHREQEGDPRHRAHRRAAHRQLLTPVGARRDGPLRWWW